MLKSLKLFIVILDLDDATSFLWMPNLVTLSVRVCSGFPNAKIYAPNLCEIVISGAETSDLGHFMDCRKLKSVILTSSLSNQEKSINLTYLLNCWPEVRIFDLDSYYFKSFATEVERLTTCLNSLRSLALVMFGFDDGRSNIFSSRNA
ncbi:hypothetical protein RND71_013307 [Anisodus tanguticus]|uniref:Uncharacterized protein n=1 Tax=Anisodus tanguticus TaxID=243964 RepID=A0AAE1SGU7_9SOLA|nr:hypothetical protein RND71_013307 [Anisodus tanguticus]